MRGVPKSKAEELQANISTHYVSDFLKLARDMPETAERIERAKKRYDAKIFNLVVTSGKPGVGKSQLIRGILAEPKLLQLLPAYTTTPYKFHLLKAEYEPVEDLANLRARGYDKLKVEDTGIEGRIIDESPGTVMLLLDNEELELSKSLSTLVMFDDTKIVGQIERDTPDDETIVLKKIDGATEKIDRLDIKVPPTTTEFVGKRKQVFSVCFKDEKEPDKQIEAQAVANYANRDDVLFIAVELNNKFLINHPTTYIVDTPYLNDLIDDEDRAARLLLTGSAFLFLFNGLITQAEKEALEELRKITDAIYFVQTKIDTYTEERAWKEQRRSNVQIIAEALDLPPGDIKYFSVSTREKRKADQTQDPKALEANDFPQLLKFLDEKLGETDENIDSRSRDFLQKLKFETETLLLRVGLNKEELSKFEDWFNKTYKPLKATFDDKAEDILSQTRTQMRETFGAYGYRPITAEFMEKYRDKKAKQLITEVKDIQRLYLDVCIKKIEPIFLSHIEKMDKLCSDIVKQMKRPWEGSVESPAIKLSMRYIDNLSQLPGKAGETLQSLMYPLMIAGGALTGGTGIPVMAVAAGALWLVSRDFKHRESEIMQAEKTTNEIVTILNGILTIVNEETNDRLQKLFRTYTAVMKNEFESLEEEATKTIEANETQSALQKVEGLLENIEKLLENINKGLAEIDERLNASEASSQ